MPKLPSYQDVGNVSPTIQRDPGVKAPVEAFQSGAGIAAQELAPSLRLVSDVVRQEEHRIDTAKVNDARRQLLDYENDRTDWLSQQKGEKVFDAKAQLDKGNEATITQIGNTLTNDRQRKAFKEVAGDWLSGFNRTSSRYIAAEMDRHYDDVDNKLLATSSRAAQKSASLGEFDRVQQEWSDQEKVIAGYAERKGLDAAGRQAMLDNQKSNFHSGIAMQLVSDGNLNGAKAYLNANKKEFDADDSLKIERLIRAHKNEQTGEARALLQEKLQDGNAMASRGVVPPNDFISNDLIQAAYPDKDIHAEQARRQVNLMYRYANDVAGLKNRGNNELEQFVNARAPSANRPDQFAEEARIQDHLRAEAAQIIKERQTAPMSYAAQNRIGSVNPIDVTNPQNVAVEIPNRVKTAYTMTNMYGSPLMPLEKTESAAMGRYLDGLTYDKKTAYLDTLYQSAKDPQAYQAILQAIRPDSPVTANVGILMGKAHEQEGGTAGIPVVGISNNILGIPEAPPSVKARSVVVNSHLFGPDESMDARSVALTIAKGEDLLNPMKADKQSDGKPRLFKMPPEEQLRDGWRSYVGDAYGSNQEAENHAYQAYRAFYAASAVQARAGDISVDSGIAQKAARAVSGGVTSSVGGQAVVLPWGMSEDDFYAKTQAQWPSIKERIRNPNASFGDIKLINAPADGQYIVYAGSGPVYDKRGQPIVIQVK